MLKLNYCSLPSIKSQGNSCSKRNKLFFHYLNHKLKDIPNSNTNSDMSVLESIIKSFNNEYRPERYSKKIYFNSTIIDDSLEDIRSVAHMAVWEATEKYIWGINKKINSKVVHIEYEDKFDFCVFASEQVKFKLRTYLRQLNTNRICGKLPDSDKFRHAYSKLPKLKLEKKYSCENGYEKISKKLNIENEVIKVVDSFITTKTTSGDEIVLNERDEKIGSKWDQLEEKDLNNNFIVDKTEQETQINLMIDKFNKIKSKFLNNLSIRDRVILKHTKFKEFNNIKDISLKDLGKKFNISAERVRQISENKFDEFKKVIIKNKNNLELE